MVHEVWRLEHVEQSVIEYENGGGDREKNGRTVNGALGIEDRMCRNTCGVWE